MSIGSKVLSRRDDPSNLIRIIPAEEWEEVASPPPAFIFLSGALSIRAQRKIIR